MSDRTQEIKQAFLDELKSVSDIASGLGIPEGTVKSRLSRGRKLLKSMLTEVVCHD